VYFKVFLLFGNPKLVVGVDVVIAAIVVHTCSSA
jgi:hypothetical protein